MSGCIFPSKWVPSETIIKDYVYYRVLKIHEGCLVEICSRCKWNFSRRVDIVTILDSCKRIETDNKRKKSITMILLFCISNFFFFLDRIKHYTRVTITNNDNRSGWIILRVSLLPSTRAPDFNLLDFTSRWIWNWLLARMRCEYRGII